MRIPDRSTAWPLWPAACCLVRLDKNRLWAWKTDSYCKVPNKCFKIRLYRWNRDKCSLNGLNLSCGSVVRRRVSCRRSDSMRWWISCRHPSVHWCTSWRGIAARCCRGLAGRSPWTWRSHAAVASESSRSGSWPASLPRIRIRCTAESGADSHASIPSACPEDWSRLERNYMHVESYDWLQGLYNS